MVIAILGILGGIAIPRFMDATASARGAKIIADMRTIDSAIMMYQAKNGTVPTAAQLTATGGGLAAWPVPPEGDAKVTATDKTEITITIASGDAYDITSDRCTLSTDDPDGKDMTVDEILNK